MEQRGADAGIDTDVAHSARIWNYWLGGKDHYDVDSQVGEEIARAFPAIVRIARADRAFLARAVRHLADEAGVRQFLDIGTGLPTVDNTHEVAQRAAPDARIVYVDNDPLVLAHARALLSSTPEGATDYLDADLREPATILEGAARTLDLTRPVAVTLLGIVHFLLDDEEAREIVGRLMDAVPSGSHLVLSHATAVVDPAGISANIRLWNEHGEPRMRTRTPEEIARLFTGLDLLDPGVVSFPHWRPEPSPWGPPEPLDGYCGVARKP
ncbi:SAM-dependent methyltransferase [Streptomyces albiaxialis]|uniref:SAM-dependent methyltransferase n=1 Tax=Streptomyces albiaxialis TaxID=329523 RepID=A0ABP5HMK2_9ACTN